MGKRTKISWCDSTFNPWVGCSKVSPGCANCYAEHDTPARVLGVKWGPGEPRHRTSANNWRQPEAWNVACQNFPWRCGLCGGRFVDPDFLGNPFCVCPKCNGLASERGLFQRNDRVFCGSLCDWLDPEVPIEWLADLLDLIQRTPNLNWLLLTKQPGQWRSQMERLRKFDHGLTAEDRTYAGNMAEHWLAGTPPLNVRFGVSAEDQERWDKRVPLLRSIPATSRFVSVEPMLERIVFTGLRNMARPAIDWIIFGGESGPKARPCDVAWIRDGLRQCREAGVPAFVKQLGSRPMTQDPEIWTMHGLTFGPLTVRDLKGADPSEWTADLHVRQFPG